MIVSLRGHIRAFNAVGFIRLTTSCSCVRASRAKCQLTRVLASRLQNDRSFSDADCTQIPVPPLHGMLLGITMTTQQLDSV